MSQLGESVGSERGSNSNLIALALPLTALTLFVSAFLLFSVQPFFAKMVLPKLGGTPAVWSVAMVFFQAVLLAGYGYAHLLTSRLNLKHAVLVHAAVLVLAFFALPIAIPASWQTPPAEDQTLWLIGLFCVSVGLPFFAVSANGPLLQAWFAKTGHPHADDPYFLYGASNVGSFASLILYVVMIEPLFDLSQQSWLWTTFYALLVLLIMLSGATALRLADSTDRSSGISAGNYAGIADAAVWAKWITLSFIPSALLVAVTAHVSTDIAAAPFLWIVPLALFLLTFVIVFQKRPLLSAILIQKIMPFLVLPLLFLTLNPFVMPLWLSLPLHFLTFFMVAMASHGALVSLRPASSQLTQFYFAMSIGGVLGGIFASLISIRIFSWIAEYPILLVASLLVVPMLRQNSVVRQTLIALGGTLAFVALMVALRGAGLFDAFESTGNLGAVNGILALAAFYFLFRNPRIVFVMSMLMLGTTIAYMGYFNGTYSARSFFGVVRVVDNPLEGTRKFQHGTTLHGAMRLKDAIEVTDKPLPLTYYTSDGGLSIALEHARRNGGGKLDAVGIVGVGAGSLACQLLPGEKLDLFEIDPLVMEIAKDRKWFRFLPDCGQGAREFLGDGRLVMGQVNDKLYDALVIDAFSSDSIPVHMMTAEAIELFMRKVKDGGMLIMHISNNHMELESVVAANAGLFGLKAVSGFFTPVNDERTLGLATRSRVAVLVRNSEDLGSLATDLRWHDAEAGTTRPWTDGYSNLIAAIWRARQN